MVSEKTGQMVEAAAGVIGTLTGKNASLAKDDDYQTTLTFYCKIINQKKSQSFDWDFLLAITI